MVLELSENGGFQELRAAATALDHAVVRQDFMSVVRHHLREETIFWPLLKKEPAEADKVQELLETPGTGPSAGFISKFALNPVEEERQNYDFTGVPQTVKAVGGSLKFGHYARSLYAQQGRPFGDIMARQTKRLIIQTVKTLERACFIGDETANPLSFNGILKQMPVSNQYEADVTAGDSVLKKLRGIVRLAINDEDILKSITHIFCTGLGVELIEEETDNRLEYHNLDIIRPGFRVPGIITQAGFVPFLPTPYIRDLSGGSFDTVYYYLVDMNQITWKGVYPEGGARTFEPQIFEVSQYTDTAHPYLLEKRFCLAYGTLFIENRGLSCYRLAVKVPAGRVGNI